MSAARCRACAELGIFSDLITPPDSVTTEEMLDLVADLNARDDIDGILIQLPLPAQVDTKALLDAVSPAKDVDGFHPVNAGRLQAGRPALAPCTPAGIIEILKRSGIPIAGQHAVVVGRSDIVGKPAAMLLLHENATVTICHSKTRDLGAITRQADILVAAIGRAGLHHAGDGQARRHHHRCGHQPHHRRARSSTGSFRAMPSARPHLPSEARPSWAMCIQKHLSWPEPIRLFPAAWACSPIAMLMANTVRAATMRRENSGGGAKGC